MYFQRFKLVKSFNCQQKKMNFIDFSSDIQDTPYQQSPFVTGLINHFNKVSTPQLVAKDVLCEVCKISVSSLVKFFSLFSIFCIVYNF